MKLLAVFAASPTLEGFRVRELLAVAEVLRVDVTPVRDVDWLAGDDADCFFAFESHASVARLRRLATRCVLLRGLYTLLHTAPTLDDLLRRHRGHGATVWRGEDEAAFADGDYCYRVETFGHKYSAARKRDVVAAMCRTAASPLRGSVTYTHPVHTFVVFAHHRATPTAPGTRAHNNNDSNNDSNNDDDASAPPLLRVFHTVLLAEGQRGRLLAQLSLQRRPYIGTTSMPPEEALIMTNLARITRAQLVYDPFAGTGSLLLAAAAHAGARTLASDADARAMRGGSAKSMASPQMQQQRQLALAAHTADELARLSPHEREVPTMWTNFRLHSVPVPDRVRLDFSTWPAVWRRDGAAVLDCVLTDPPYGLREQRRRVTQTTTTTSATASRADEYDMADVALDVVLFAAEHLRVGGTVCFWHATSDAYIDDELPTHPCLRVIENVPQRLSLKVVRRLIVMRKVAVLPQPRPCRAACAPRVSAADLRKLMDVTELPSNREYMHYRDKVQRKRDAVARYHASHADAAQRSCCSSSSSSEQQQQQHEHADDAQPPHRPCPCRRRRRNVEWQHTIVSNRTRNLRVRDEKQQASHRDNAAAAARRHSDAT